MIVAGIFLHTSPHCRRSLNMTAHWPLRSVTLPQTAWHGGCSSWTVALCCLRSASLHTPAWRTSSLMDSYCDHSLHLAFMKASWFSLLSTMLSCPGGRQPVNFGAIEGLFIYLFLVPLLCCLPAFFLPNFHVACIMIWVNDVIMNCYTRLSSALRRLCHERRYTKYAEFEIDFQKRRIPDGFFIRRSQPQEGL